jgi:hypothetical protein
MPESAARNIRNVKTDSQVARPRDAALRSSAFERAERYRKIQSLEADKNRMNDAYPTVDQSFVSDSNERTIQPTLNQSATVRNSNVQYQKSSGGSRRGQNQIRSVATTKSRPSMGRPSLKRAIPNVPILDVNPVKLVRATSVSITNLSWGMGLYAAIQLPLAALSIGLLGVTYIMYDVIPDMIRATTGETIYKGLSWITDKLSGAVSSAVESIFGYNLTELLNPAAYFVATYFLVFMIGLATLILCAIIYQISLINCLFGKHAGLKIGTFIFAIFGYMVPILNIFPWFLFWVLVVWRYPE